MSVFKSNLLLLGAAAIWGFAFVAQRVGMDYVGPFTFGGVRFMLGSLALLPLVFIFRTDNRDTVTGFKAALVPGLIAGSILFIASSFQQIGLLYTTAGKSAFVTCLYIVLVPIVGIFLGQKVSRWTWLACVLAMVGLYFLCIKETASLQRGDLLELAGALFWSFHILVIGYFSRRVDVLKLSCLQCVTCSILSLIAAVITEDIVVSGIMGAAVPILYGGLCSVGIAYTLQVIGQKHAPPAPAAIIFSMETVFAVLGGYLLIGERMGTQEIIGCLLMFTGMLVSQLQNINTPQEEKLQQGAGLD